MSALSKLAAAAITTKAKRDRAIFEAFDSGRLSQQAIASETGLSINGVRKIIAAQRATRPKARPRAK